MLVDHNSWSVLNHDPLRNITTLVRFEGEKMHIAYAQQIPDDFWQQNRELAELTQPKRNTQDHIRHVARIPDAIANQWTEELGNPVLDPDAQKAWDKRLNSREFHKLRVHDGQL